MDVLIEHLLKIVPLNSLNFIGTLIVIGVLYWSIRPQLAKLTDQVAQTNGNVRELKQWKDDHTMADDSRHQENLGRFDDVAESIRDLNKTRWGK